MNFYNRQKKWQPVIMEIKHCEIVKVNVTKFLGVVINKNLTWTDQSNAISNKISKNIGAIR